MKHPASSPTTLVNAGESPEALPRGFHPMRLKLQSTGLTILCKQPDLLVGRHSTCEVRLPTPDVSRQHCRLRFVNGRWVVGDLRSTNGIKLNGQRVTSASLKQGDRLQIGSFTFDVDFPAGTGKPTSESGVLHSIAATLRALDKVKTDLPQAG